MACPPWDGATNDATLDGRGTRWAVQGRCLVNPQKEKWAAGQNEGAIVAPGVAVARSQRDNSDISLAT